MTQQHTISLEALEQKEWSTQLAASVADRKALAARYKGGTPVRYVVEDHRDDLPEPKLVYDGYSLADAVACYNDMKPRAAKPAAPALTVSDLIARSEAIPGRKAALDRARIRSAVAAITLAALKKRTPEELVAELCSTPEGLAQYEQITNREAGEPYHALRLDSGMPMAEVIAGLFPTEEARAEFEASGQELRSMIGAEGAGEDHLTTVATAALFLLGQARETLAQGLETEGPHEAEWSQADRELVARIDAVLKNFLAKKLLAAA